MNETGELDAPLPVAVLIGFVTPGLAITGAVTAPLLDRRLPQRREGRRAHNGVA